MKTALIAGASGLVGNALLNLLTNGDVYDRIIMLTRRPVHTPDSKTTVIQVDFAHIEDLNPQFRVDDVFCCLGTTMKKAGSQEAFKKVDFEYPLNLANWRSTHQVHSFSIISSIGASTKTTNFYIKTKGEVEEAIKMVNLPMINIYRPSLLLGHRNEFRLAERISEKLAKLIVPVMVGQLRKYRAIEANQVAKSMYLQAQKDQTGITILESNDIATF